MKVSFAKPEIPAQGALVLGVLEGAQLSPLGREVDTQTGDALTRAIAAYPRFKGEAGQSLSLAAPHGLTASRVLLIGLGKADGLSASGLESFGASVQSTLNHTGDSEGVVVIEAALLGGFNLGEAAARVALGARLRSYRFDKYHTTQKDDEKPQLATLTVAVEDPAAAEAAYAPLRALAKGVFLTRDLVSEPANVLYPESFAAQCEDLKKLGIEVEVLGEKEMRKLGMGALLGVAQGSAREPKLVVLSYHGGKKGDQPVAFIGKGVCFDSGGISIKPAANMEDMKWDMGGAGVVAGLFKALAGRKAKVNAVGLMGLVENMPSGTAQRPGDVVTSMSGQTIEVINTDAEGRLVLADVLHYCNDRFKPRQMIDLATLTGAIIIALGTEHAGVFSNDDALAEGLAKAGKATGEKVWRLPLGDAYDKQINSDIADMRNSTGREGGSITAAQFLKRFVGETPWAHIDIAGVTWSKKDAGIVPKGGTGFGVRLLDAYVAETFEEAGK
ncbi:leucyl aminopeptidase [Rhodospirillum rubrum]|uniref:leucyl aminopeptidase n=1 Tax=Rhodospirillum rubrum TaxID=1085 RepID=UPI001903BB6A|nr:leucyl aminopeptidase [Rhodospirillum rubrum]MBK1663388.1 leucyl aminopeptidase [Rhodospirillum rubrum]MBK1675560.1 leucyl aminopeptidase [Rhodospirillum rubrum]